MVPSEPIADDEATPPVPNSHFFVPLGYIEYSFSSLELTYIVPSKLIAGDEDTWAPVANSHFFVPLEFNAYT
jgi:hypothetical protein